MKQGQSTAFITRTQGRIPFLERCMGSVVNQGSADWVHVIVNDGGPRDALEDLKEKFAERYGDRLRVIHHDKPHGRGAAANAGFAAAKDLGAEFCCVLDDDDSLDPQYLEIMTAALGNPRLPESVRAVRCGHFWCKEVLNGDEIQQNDRRAYPYREEIKPLANIGWGLTFPPLVLLFKTSALETLKGYPEDIPYTDVYDFYTRFLYHFDIIGVRDCLAYYSFRGSAGKGLYANTAEHHAFWIQVTKNRLIREDCRDNRVGLGFLLMLSEELFRAQRPARNLEKLQRPLRSLIRKAGDLRRKMGRAPKS
jgi:glycosyltransferase involved in cell wall biosynthesis